MTKSQFEVGDRVRLTGVLWDKAKNLFPYRPGTGEEVTISRVDERGLPWGDYEGRGYPIDPIDYTAELVTEPSLSTGGYVGVGKPVTFDFHVIGMNADVLDKAFGFTPKPVEHPNFVQVYLECDYGRTNSWEASRRVEAVSKGYPYPESWVIPEQYVSSLAEIDGLRLLLDAIEDRLIAEGEEDTK